MKGKIEFDNKKPYFTVEVSDEGLTIGNPYYIPLELITKPSKKRFGKKFKYKVK